MQHPSVSTEVLILSVVIVPCSAPLKGTMICRGKLILMADADGATKFSDIEKAESALHDLSPKPV